MADYITKGSFNLGNQITLKNKNSNIDRDYGPYEGKTLEEIAALLTDTIQIGKTIGVIESGNIVEYWWQQEGDGYAFVKKGEGKEIVVDSELSLTSTNPIQNQAVAGALGGKADSSIVSGIDSRVGTLEGTITSKADSSTVEALQATVASKAESGEVTALSDRVDSVETELDGKVSSNTFNDTIGSLNGDIAGKADKVAKQEVSGDQTISPNTMYVWRDSVAGALTITKGGEIAGIVNNYMVRFTAGEGCAVTFNEFEIDWYGGKAPTWTTGHTYEISIVDNIALWAEF